MAARGQPPASLTPPTHPPNVHPTHPQVHAFTPLGERLPSAAFSLGAEAEGEGVAEAQVFRDGVAALTPGRRLWCARALGGGGGAGAAPRVGSYRCSGRGAGGVCVTLQPRMPTPNPSPRPPPDVGARACAQVRAVRPRAPRNSLPRPLPLPRLRAALLGGAATRGLPLGLAGGEGG